MKIHAWSGFVLAFYALLATVTGLSLVYRDQLVRLAYQPAGHQTIVSAEHAVQAAEEARQRFGPGLGSIVHLPRPGANYLMFHAPDDRQTLVSADDGAAISGESSIVTALDWLYLLHTRWVAGSTAKLAITVLAILWLAVVIVGSIVVWPRRRALNLKALWPGSTSRSALIRMHQMLGFLLVLPLTVMLLTGVGLQFPEQAHQLLSAVLGGAHHEVHAHDSAGEGRCDPARLVREANSMFPGAAATLFYWPDDGRNYYRVRMRNQDDFPINGRVSVYFDAGSCGVLTSSDGTASRAGDSVSAALYTVHAGKFLGSAAPTFIALVGLVTLLVVATGVTTFVKRRPWAKPVAPARS